jgi:T4 RnlA family RNA ligase
MNKLNLQKMIDEKYISVQKHPTEELYIYSYTEKAQYDRMWNNETLSCRGLILDKDNNVIARPFSKFFNLEEAINQGQQLPVEDFVVQEKFDGSLGILYWVGDKPFLATRGSFVSDQSQVGTEILQGYAGYFGELNRDYTYLFEIIYPENRIVVDYKGRRDLVLLAVVDIKTGEEKDLYENCSGFPFAGFVDGVDDYKMLSARAEDNKEGFVIKFKSGKRYKVKFEEYVRLHRLITCVNARSIWDLLRSNQPFDELLERVPDEFYEWVKKTKEDLQFAYMNEEREALRAFDEIRLLPTRKEQALTILKKYKDISAVIFSILDEKAYAEVIWKKLRPSAEKPWKEEI